MTPALRTLSLTLALLGTARADSAMPSPPPHGPSRVLSGSWSGTVIQDRVESYPTRMRLDESGQGSIEYPTLGCGGTLTLVSRDGSTLVYRERITYGRDRCIDQGTLRLTPAGPSLRNLGWDWQGSDVRAIGRLAGRGRID